MARESCLLMSYNLSGCSDRKTAPKEQGSACEA